MAGHAAPNIVEDGLVFLVDAANPRSWTGPNSSTVNDLIGTPTGSIFNDTSGSYGDNNSFAFDGTDDYIDTNLSTNINSFSVSCWFKGDNLQTGAQKRLFDFADSTLEEEFKIYQERRQQDVKEGKNKNTSLSRNYKTFENAKSFRVRFYNSKYGDMLVGPYRKLIEDTILSKNKQKLDSLDEKEINKMMSETLTLEKKKNILAMSLDNAMVA